MNEWMNEWKKNSNLEIIEINLHMSLPGWKDHYDHRKKKIKYKGDGEMKLKKSESPLNINKINKQPLTCLDRKCTLWMNAEINEYHSKTLKQ